MNKRKTFITVFIFLFCYTSYAQVGKQKQALIDIIKQLEEQFECSFSYVDESVKNIAIKIPSNKNTLQDILNFLEESTSLKFTILENNSIAISVKLDSISICGYLIDFDTQEVVQNALIKTASSSTLSDEQGYFELKNLSASSTVLLRHIGYKSTTYLINKFDKNVCSNYYLIPKVEQIREVVIRNYLTKGIKKTTSGSIAIDYKNFGILPGLIENDVLQTLQSLPGVQSVDERVANINIRGGSHHENLILWDGIKMYQSGHFFGLISAFNPYLTKNVKLIKNGTSADLSDGVSGSVLMFTDAIITKQIKASVGVNLINADIFLDLPLGKKSSIQLSGRKSIRDLIQTSAYKQYFQKAFQNTEVVNNSENVINSNDEFSFGDVNVRWLYSPTNKDKIRVNFLTFNNDLVYLENAFVNEVEESKESGASQNNLAGGISYQRSWNDRLSTELQFNASKYLLKSKNFDLLNEQRLIQENEVLEEGIKLDAAYKLNSSVTLYGGYQFVETGVSNVQDVDNPIFKSRIKEVIRSHGLSTQIGYHSKDKNSNLRAGFRVNYLEKFGAFIFEPRFSFSQQFLNYFTLEVQGEFKHQTTTQVVDFQNDFLGVENRHWILANELEVPVLKSKQTSIGINFSENGWIISTEAYYKFVDGVTTQSQGFQNQYQYVKAIGSYTVLGGDILINKRFKQFSTWLNYSVVDNNYRFESLEDVEFPNNYEIRHALKFGMTYELNSFKIGAGFNWHTGKPTTMPIEGNEIIGDQINYQPSNSSYLSDYLRTDLSVQYAFNFSKKIKANTGISVWNITNKKNVTNSFYRLTNDKVDLIEQSSLGITPNVSFRVVF